MTSFSLGLMRVLPRAGHVGFLPADKRSYGALASALYTLNRGIGCIQKAIPGRAASPTRAQATPLALPIGRLYERACPLQASSPLRLQLERCTSVQCMQVYRGHFSSQAAESDQNLQLESLGTFTVCIVGAGPSGFYCAKALLRQARLHHQQIEIVLIDKLPTPFGLVRYGVAADKPEMKAAAHQLAAVSRDSSPKGYFEACRRGYRQLHADTQIFNASHNVCLCFILCGMSNQVAETPNVFFRGNVMLGRDVLLEELRALFDVVVLAMGAADGVSLPVPGATLSGVCTAHDLVLWFNGHPAMQGLEAHLGKAHCTKALVVGHGNVALDVARVLLKAAVDTPRTQPQAREKTDPSGVGIEGSDAAARSASSESLMHSPVPLWTTDINEAAYTWARSRRFRWIRVIGRRGPAQASFTNKELRAVRHPQHLEFLCWLPLPLPLRGRYSFFAPELCGLSTPGQGQPLCSTGGWRNLPRVFASQLLKEPSLLAVIDPKELEEGLNEASRTEIQVRSPSVCSVSYFMRRDAAIKEEAKGSATLHSDGSERLPPRPACCDVRSSLDCVLILYLHGLAASPADSPYCNSHFVCRPSKCFPLKTVGMSFPSSLAAHIKSPKGGHLYNYVVCARNVLSGPAHAQKAVSAQHSQPGGVEEFPASLMVWSVGFKINASERLRPVPEPAAAAAVEGSGEAKKQPLPTKGLLSTVLPTCSRGLLLHTSGRVLPPHQEDAAVEERGTNREKLGALYVSGWFKGGPKGTIADSLIDAQQTAQQIFTDRMRSSEKTRESMSPSSPHDCVTPRNAASTADDPKGRAAPPPSPDSSDALAALDALLGSRGVQGVSFDGWKKIAFEEETRGKAEGRTARKVVCLKEMLRIAAGGASALFRRCHCTGRELMVPARSSSSWQASGDVAVAEKPLQGEVVVAPKDPQHGQELRRRVKGRKSRKGEPHGSSHQ
ncbi:mitochondrial NADPH:adrenodoxin [Cyclospora cayetanensis]|uniref:Mitochondrial NADPH:adrenodoxin n=1 Tax=Cyclospora cayetanensis TaxID=88456 RepID=A0A1D3D777_9EIME|nr:mitochondrial NADPH:adrenodoxin [Cyclospora cayetanensis]